MTLFIDLLRKEAEKVIETRILEESLHCSFTVFVLNFSNGGDEISAIDIRDPCANDCVKNLNKR